MKTLSAFTQALLSRGKYFFSKKEALAALNISENQFVFQAYRLSKKKQIRRLTRDFFMIIPAEYYALGSLPPHWVIDALMQHLGRDYYIALLSAASLYGATNQQPMVFQVIVDKPMRRIMLPRGGIEFHKKIDSENSAVSLIPAPTGYQKISTKEQTIIDLVRYYEVSGGMSNVALIIKELGPECSAKLFKEALKKEKNTALLQRLGYLLDFTGQTQLARAVKEELAKRRYYFVLLRPDYYKKAGERLLGWKLILNDYVEL